MKYRTPAALEAAVREAARSSSMDTGRVIESFYCHRLFCRIFSDPESRFVLKGGRSALARTTRARYSRDADFAVSDMGINEAIEKLDELAKTDMGDFISFGLSGVTPIRAEDEYREGARLRFSVSIGAKSLQPTIIDLVADEVPGDMVETVTPADRVEVGNLPVCDYHVAPVAYSLADKFCAIMEVHNGRSSSRVKDLIDILVYIEEDVDVSVLADKLMREAAMRGFHLPSTFTVPKDWRERYLGSYKKMIKEVGLDTKYPNIDTAVAAAGNLYNAALLSRAKRVI